MSSARQAVSAEALTARALRQLRSGTLIGDRFALRDLIVQGGMGLAFRAWELEWERDCVLKVLSPHMHPRFVSEPDCAKLLRREAQILVKLSGTDSSAFVQIYGRGEVKFSLDDDGDEILLPYYAMELLRGATLQRIIGKKRRTAGEGLAISWYTVVTLAQKIAGALAVAHSLDYVHRDLKPDNIYVHRLPHRWEAKIIDWGIATVEGEPRRYGSGTDRYSSPELVTAVSPGDSETTKSDIYPLGLVFYELATGRGPFEVRKGEFASAHRWQIPPRLSEFRPEAPPAFVDLVASMLAKKPSDRPSAADVSAALGDVLRNMPNEEVDAQIDDLLPAGPQRRAVPGAAFTRPLASIASARTPAQDLTPVHSETFSPRASKVVTARSPATAPFPDPVLHLPIRYPDTEPDGEPFGLFEGAPTAPTGNVHADAAAKVRLFHSAAEIFDLWEDDTRYASSPLQEAAPAPIAAAAVAPTVAVTPRADVVSADGPIVLQASPAPEGLRLAHRIAFAVVGASVGLLLSGIALRATRPTATPSRPVLTSGPAIVAPAASDTDASARGQPVVVDPPTSSAEHEHATPDAGSIREAAVPASAPVAKAHPTSRATPTPSAEPARTSAESGSLDDLNRDISH